MNNHQSLSIIISELLKSESAEIKFNSIDNLTKWKIIIKLYNDKSVSHSVYFSNEIEIDLKKVQAEYKIKNATTIGRIQQITADEIITLLQNAKIFKETYLHLKEYNGNETNYEAIVDVLTNENLKPTAGRFGL